MRRSSVKEYAEAIRGRYERSRRQGKGQMLDEFTAVTGYHRKSAIRLLSGTSNSSSGGRRGRPHRYGQEVTEALREAWEAADRICGKRLKPFLSELVPKLQECGELDVSPQSARALCELSASTIDRLLRPYKDRGGRRGLSTTKPGSLLKASIPIRTFADWNEDRPGFLEMDLVAHCGESTEGFYLNTLSTVDIATCWIECRAVWGKGQDRVGSAVHHVAQSLPFPLLGLDSDSGGEFINQHLYSYCQRLGITFTRSRPYKKNDNAHVEQKNWSVVRKLVGYDRYSSRDALEQLQRTYLLVGQYTNFFQPAMKLLRKTRHGARVHKVYDVARTPYRRLLERQVMTPDQQALLAQRYHRLNPAALLRQIDRSINKLYTLADHHRDLGLR
jgi:hypothetical protein